VQPLPALVLTAGRATRLRPLSLVRAKAAVPVAGIPLACRVLQWLAGHGVRDAVLNLHHLPHTLTRLVGDGAHLGLRVRYSWEDQVLGSAGGPRHALPLLDASRFLIVNGDTLTNLDLPALVSAHERSGALVSMAVVPNPNPAKYGGVLVEGDRVSGFTPRGSAGPSFHFIGVQVAERAAFEALPDGTPSESVGQLYPTLMRRQAGAVHAHVSHARFEDVGTPADYFATAMDVAAREGAPDLQLGDGCARHATARLERCILWDDVRVAADVTLTECIVTDGVRVPAGTTLVRRTILPGSGDNLLVAPF
jgi:mannose-1-phosphate guanylyltransferase